MADQDRELVARCLHGDQESWDGFYQRYAGSIRNGVTWAPWKGQLGATEDALVARVFAQVAEALVGYTERVPLDIWVRRACDAVCIASYEAPPQQGISVGDLPSGRSPSSRGLPAEVERASRGLRACQTLPAPQQELIRLHYVEGLDFEEMERALPDLEKPAWLPLSRAVHQVSESMRKAGLLPAGGDRRSECTERTMHPRLLASLENALSAEEAEEVRAHLAGCESCQERKADLEALGRLLGPARERSRVHTSPQLLVRWAEDEKGVPPTDRASAEIHHVFCRRCRTAIRLLQRRFREVPLAGPPVDGPLPAGLWETVRGLLPDRPPAAVLAGAQEGDPDSPPSPSPGNPMHGWYLVGIAASFLALLAWFAIITNPNRNFDSATASSTSDRARPVAVSTASSRREAASPSERVAVAVPVPYRRPSPPPPSPAAARVDAGRPVSLTTPPSSEGHPTPWNKGASPAPSPRVSEAASKLPVAKAARAVSPAPAPHPIAAPATPVRSGGATVARTPRHPADLPRWVSSRPARLEPRFHRASPPVPRRRPIERVFYSPRHREKSLRLERSASEETRRILGRRKFAIRVDVERSFEVGRVTVTTEQPITTRQEMLLKQRISKRLEVRQEVVKMKVGPVPPAPPAEAPKPPDVPKAPPPLPREPAAPAPPPPAQPGKPTPP